MMPKCCDMCFAHSVDVTFRGTVSLCSDVNATSPGSAFVLLDQRPAGFSFAWVSPLLDKPLQASAVPFL